MSASENTNSENFVTQEEFLQFKINNNDSHEYLSQLILDVKDNFESKINSLNSFQNQISKNQKELKNSQSEITKSIGAIKSTIDKLSSKTKNFDIDEISKLKDNLQNVIVEATPALAQFKIAGSYFEKEVEIITQREIDRKAPLLKKVLKFWPVILGVFTGLGVIISALGVLINWSLTKGLKHHNLSIKKSNKLLIYSMDTTFNKYKSQIDSSNLRLTLKVDGMDNTFIDKLEILNLKINTLHNIKK